MPGSEVGVTSLFIAFFAGEGVAALIARGPLVVQLFAPRQVVQVLDALAGLVAHPARAAQVVGVVPVGGVVRTNMSKADVASECRSLHLL